MCYRRPNIEIALRVALPGKKPSPDTLWLNLTGKSLEHALNAIGPLRLLLDRHEDRLVREARNVGYSWDVIAMHLGVRRQTAHARYARSLAELSAV